MVNVSTVAALVSAVDNAAAGTTIRLADGTYAFNGERLWIATPIYHSIGQRQPGGRGPERQLHETPKSSPIVASGVTIADLTLREA